MILSRSKSRVVGLQAGEVSINLLSGQAIVRAKFALVADDGSTVGHFDKAGSWSERTADLLQQLTQSMESDALPHLFDAPAEELKPGRGEEEPPQL